MLKNKNNLSNLVWYCNSFAVINLKNYKLEFFLIRIYYKVFNENHPNNKYFALANILPDQICIIMYFIFLVWQWQACHWYDSYDHATGKIIVEP